MAGDVERHSGEVEPTTPVSRVHTKRFLGELRNRGFVEPHEPIQIAGLSGVYYLASLEGPNGEVVNLKYGGGEVDKIGFSGDLQPVFDDSRGE